MNDTKRLKQALEDDKKIDRIKRQNLTQDEVQAILDAALEEPEAECTHDGSVWNGRCDHCGARYESDYETYEKENPR